MNPNGPVAATGSLHGIQRKNRLLEIDKSNKQLAQRFEKVKPAVSYSEHMWSGLKQEKLIQMIAQGNKRVESYSLLAK